MSGADLFTVADQVFLSSQGIAEAPPAAGISSGWAPERVLAAAAAGELTGPNLATFTDLDVPVRLAGREITEPEARALADLVCAGHVVWIGSRITATAGGRELLARWAQYRPRGGCAR